MKRTQRESIRLMLGPRCLALGLHEVERRTGIPHGRLSLWISGNITAGRNRPARLNDLQVEAVAAAVGVRLVIAESGRRERANRNGPARRKP